jgi:hypothetical protein
MGVVDAGVTAVLIAGKVIGCAALQVGVGVDESWVALPSETSIAAGGRRPIILYFPNNNMLELTRTVPVPIPYMRLRVKSHRIYYKAVGGFLLR